jgi:hypothetical protein
VSSSIVIPSRFNGPRESGNGGYCAGAIAAFVDGSGAVEVSLRRPVPLDTSLSVSHEDDGRALGLDGEELVIEAKPTAGLDLDVPAPVSVEEARSAAERYRGLTGNLFSRCFVCGRDREDSLEVFAGPVEGRELVASSWMPPEWTADDSGDVRPEIVWAVLDCPTYFAAYLHHEDPLPPGVLARITARLDRPVAVGEEHVVIAWPIEADGRKHHAGVAVVSTGGEVLASARALLIEPRQG